MKPCNFHPFLILIAILLSNCSAQSDLQRDSFYSKGSGRDYLRFPLIKPYYAIYISNRDGWGVPLKADPPSDALYYYYQLHGVEKIAVQDGVIMVYTPYKEDVDESVGQKILYWFVFIPDQNIEMGFENKVDFNSYIQQYNIQDPHWLKPDDILQQFESTTCLDWIPGCK